MVIQLGRCSTNTLKNNQQSNENSTICRMCCFSCWKPCISIQLCLSGGDWWSVYLEIAVSPIECIGRSGSCASTKAQGGQSGLSCAGFPSKFQHVGVESLFPSCGPNFSCFNVKPGNNIRLLHHEKSYDLEG